MTALVLTLLTCATSPLSGFCFGRSWEHIRVTKPERGSREVRVAKCTTCSAELIFARTESGKAMPLNARPEYRFTIDTDGVCHAVKTYTPHWASCNAPDQHRRARPSEKERKRG